MADGKPVLTNDPGSHPDRVGLPVGHPPLKAFLGVPLIRGGRTIGMVAVANRTGGYDQNDVHALESLAPAIVETFGRKRAEEALRKTTRRFQTIVDHAPIAIYVKDRDGRFVFANRKLEQYTGHPLERLLGMTDYDFAPKEDADRWRENDLKVLKGEHAEYEETGTDRDGRPYVNISVKFPLSDESGTSLEIGTISMDITARKQTEEALQQAKAAAEAASEAKSRFLANMSHELRTPMNAILGMIDVALPKTGDPTVQDCLQTVKGSADLLLTLLNDLLDSAKIESGKLELEAAPFSLRQMLDHLTQVLAVRASEKGLTFRRRVPGDVPDAVVGDRMRLQQVLLNLAGNAIKFTERGEVEIGLLISPRPLAGEGQGVRAGEKSPHPIGIKLRSY
jgi:two-component system sensor histidine kinase/response regulator